MSSVACAAQGDSKRPLDGIRVLDMTRVLAGVCFCPVRADAPPSVLNAVLVVMKPMGLWWLTLPYSRIVRKY